MQKLASSLSLFTSFGTLLCCALPALLVALGAGAALAGLVTNVPQLVWFSMHKKYFFAFSAIMLAVAGYFMHKAKNLPCPADANKAKACTKLRKRSVIVYFASLAIYATGFFFAFVIQHLI
jgi:hypothetical protein